MGRNIIKKLLSVIPLLLIISFILFFIINILPGDAAMGLAAESSNQEYIVKLRAELGLDKPFFVRYLDWLLKMLKGDLGRSLISGQPVIEKVLLRFPVTLELTLLAMLISVIVAIPLGIISAVKRNSLWDYGSSIIAMIGIAMPPFWLGILLVILFSLMWQLLPASGYVGFFSNPVENLKCMFMPAMSIGLAFAATVMRQTRSALLEVLSQDYINTARAKGLSEGVVLWKHALRNSLIPVITVISMQIGRLIGGAVVTETVFALPGIGREIVDSIFSRDYPVVMAMILLTAAFVILINTFVDLLYIIIDPRISQDTQAD